MDQLYEECRDYDLVLVPDPPFGNALTRRLERPHFGPFAITPRRLAARRKETGEDRLAFLAVIEETDLGWKEAANAIGNVLQCWDNTGDLEAILEYDAFATPTTRAVIDCLRDLDTTSGQLATHEIPPDKDVAVVGIEEFTALERSILPQEYDEIDPYADAPFDPPPFRILDSPAAIVDAILETVTAENADRVAVVLDRGSQYAPLVESALEANDVPFTGGPGFDDDPDHRAVLRFLRLAHAGSDVRVREARPVLERLGVEVAVEHDEKRLHAVDLPALSDVCARLERLPDRTFSAALDAFESATGADLGAFRDELDELGLLADRVTEEAVGHLEFYLQSYEVPVERENEGVLLADAKSAATVDRPAVFYLGMDEGWVHDTPQRPWMDRDAVYTRNLHQFQRLLQNGQDQYYLVQDERGGRAVTPCLYFEDLLAEDFERFSDLDSAAYARSFQTAGTGFDREPLAVEADPVTTISQSSLNRFVNCPRDHLFARLVDGPDRDYFAVGTLFHDFAEVAAANPEAIDDDVIDQVVDLMVETTRPFAREVDEPTERTRFRAGLETIVAFLEADPPTGADFVSTAAGPAAEAGVDGDRNVVAAHLGVDVDVAHTEWRFEEPALGMKGTVDLVHSPTRFVDYKSGGKDTAKTVVRKAALDPPHDTPEYQALLYQTFHRTRAPDERLTFTFLHFLETLDDVVAGEAALADCLTTVPYEPVAFETYLTTEAVYEELREDGPGDCRKTFEQLPYADYADVVDAHPFPDGRYKAALFDSALGDALHSRASQVVGPYTYVENGCAQALSHLARIRDTTFFADDLDAFEDFVAERIADLNRYRTGKERFPVEGLGGEPNWRRVAHRDMITEGDA